MHSNKHIEWEEWFKQGFTVIKAMPPCVMAYTKGSYINLQTIYENIVLSERFNIAPKFIDQGIHKANRIFKYYTFKQLPGAVIFLGSK